MVSNQVGIAKWGIAENSIFQSMTFYNVLERDGGGFAASDAVEGGLGEIEVLQLLDVLQDGFPGIERFGAAGTLGKPWTSLYRYSTSQEAGLATLNPCLVTKLKVRTNSPGFPLLCGETDGQRRRRRHGGRNST